MNSTRLPVPSGKRPAVAPVVSALTALALAVSGPAEAAKKEHSVRENKHAVRAWNDFVDSLEAVHRYFLSTRNVRTSEKVGGYARLPEFYREVSYIDADTGRLLSRVQWESRSPTTIHAIEIFFYDAEGRVTRDYFARFLPRFRNAPIQTLANFHHYEQDLHAFRQFDASGNAIYERCRGNWFDETVDIELDEPSFGTPPSLRSSEAYIACFGYLPRFAPPDLDPSSGIAALDNGTPGDSKDPADRVRRLSRRIALTPERAELYSARGRAYFQLQEFSKAIQDFTRALALDNSRDDAIFGRGLALGRAGKLNEAIADLSKFIERHPDSSLAYTKRGVRRIWNRDFESAEKDLKRAVALDAHNAEAHDDLGVVLARRGDHAGAIRHFREAIRNDSTYKKAHHNLALVYQMLGRHEEALGAIDSALRLDQESRSSTLLKSAILESLGRRSEALIFRREAEVLPPENWSETLPLESR